VLQKYPLGLANILARDAGLIVNAVLEHGNVRTYLIPQKIS
jgi:hypothetical protein